MPNTKYPAGFHFVINSSIEGATRSDRRVARSHVTKARAWQNEDVKRLSWLTPSREILSLPIEIQPRPRIGTTIPQQINTIFAGLRLSPEFKPYMVNDIMQFINLSKRGTYPYEVCLNVHVVEREWFPYMLNDPCCLHAILFSMRLLQGGLHQPSSSTETWFHLARTLQLLQARLYSADLATAISDATIMAVVLLASIAEITGDFAVASSHVNGLERIVSLRGGVKALDVHRNVHMKACRADLSNALLSGKSPILIKEIDSWDCFLGGRVNSPCKHLSTQTKMNLFFQSELDLRLYNVIKDMHIFSCISNLAFQTTRRLSPEMYNEMLTSLLYRLTNLSFDNDLLQETVRLAALVFSSTTFLQRQYIEVRYEQLLRTFRNVLVKFKESYQTQAPPLLTIWLLMVLETSLPGKETLNAMELQWFTETLQMMRMTSPAVIYDSLRTIAWVDFVHTERCGELLIIGLLNECEDGIRQTASER